MKYKEIVITIDKASPQGNAFSIISSVSKAIRDKYGPDKSKEFVEKAFASPSYDDLLALCASYVTMRYYKKGK